MTAGCATRGDTAALEDELRGHEDRIFSLERELRAARAELMAARREAEDLRAQAASAGQRVTTAEQAEVLYRAVGLRIDTLLTGGLDEDGVSGDEALNLVLEPFDADGTTLKLPGDLLIEVLDPAAAGEARGLGTWRFSPDQLHEAWHSGLLVTGFKFRLPWQSPPGHETLVVHARLKTSDGRTFDATETVKIMTPTQERPLAQTE